MTYNKPEVKMLATAANAIQGSTNKRSIAGDNPAQQPTAAAYEADE